MATGALVTIGRGKRLHRRYDQVYTFCGGLIINDKLPDFPICKRCEFEWQQWLSFEAGTYKESKDNGK